jgi:hypothetical protein
MGEIEGGEEDGLIVFTTGIKVIHHEVKVPWHPHPWKPSDQPAWLTEKFYAERIQPLLASL